jgi:hypothetical protein
LDENGMRTEASGKANAYKDEEDRLRVLALREQPRHVASDHFVRNLQYCFSRIEDDQPACRQAGQVEPYGFPHEAFHAITDNGFAEGSGDCKADTGSFIAGAAQIKSREALAGKAGTLIIDPAEFTGPQDPGGFRKSEPPVSGCVRFTWRSGQRVRR